MVFRDLVFQLYFR